MTERRKFGTERNHYTELEKLNLARISELDDEIKERTTYGDTLKSTQNPELAKTAIELIASENIRDQASITFYQKCVDDEKSLIESYKTKMKQVRLYNLKLGPNKNLSCLI